jgi:predicted PurR-regulated permease PerM
MERANQKSFSKPFLITLVVLILALCFFLFKGFLVEMIIAAVLVSMLYPIYNWFLKIFRGRRNLAAFVMCLLAVVFIIAPLVQLSITIGKQAVPAYNSVVSFLQNNDGAIKDSILAKAQIFGINEGNFRTVMFDALQKSSSAIVDVVASAIKGTTGFFISLGLIIFIMFFFFVDGENMLRKLSQLSPLANKHDEEIFHKFRVVSRTAFLSTFVVAATQGFVGGIGFWIAGLPVLFPMLIMATLSILPYVGSMIFYVPVGIYLIAVGQIWQGVFILAWGALLVGNIDNLLRMYLIKGKAQVNPIFIVFSIIGGISMFGFWGIIIGPLVVSLAVTMLYIYKLEFKKELADSK